MRREKAIEIIRKELLCVDRDTCKREECKSCDLVMPSKEPIIEAYQMAIKALEQEPCDDCVSRQAVKKFIEYIQSIKDNHNENGTPINYGTICDLVIQGWRLIDLPSITPIQPKAKVGKWISIYGNVKCSVCGNVKDGRSVGKATHYCDFCGAKMEVEE